MANRRSHHADGRQLAEVRGRGLGWSLPGTGVAGPAREHGPRAGRSKLRLMLVRICSLLPAESSQTSWCSPALSRGRFVALSARQELDIQYSGGLAADGRGQH